MKKRKNHFVRYLLISSIIAINFAGVSYAAWNNNLELNNTIRMGNMDIRFTNDHSIKPIQGNSDLFSNVGDSIINIQGTIESDYKGFLNYGIQNNGSIPAKFIRQNLKVDNGLTIHVNQQSGVLDGQETFYSENGNPKLQITAGEPGTYDFEFTLLFRQWNR